MCFNDLDTSGKVERGSARAPVNGRLDITPGDAHHEFELRKGGAATALVPNDNF